MVICKNKINVYELGKRTTKKYKAVSRLELDAQPRNESITETRYAVIAFFTGTLLLLKVGSIATHYENPYIITH